mmetsp:Transcript_10663/g.11721  ORF Transcript_10663/g.11721 Transcript_10663/m.11721 type:complete len:292 (+) Transcript_10663:876-1751(+)
MKHSADVLDSLMTVIFDFLGTICLQQHDTYFTALLNIFSRIILPVYETKVVQYILFYVCRYPTFAHRFLQLLYTTMINEKLPKKLRCNATHYIGSFIARSSCLPDALVRQVLQGLYQYTRSYVHRYAGALPDPNSHGVFYGACQALFYILCFKYFDLSLDAEGQQFVQSLDFIAIINSSLNPLKVCSSELSHQFVKLNIISKRDIMHQNAFDYSDMSHAPTVLPFDPYVLRESHAYIKPLYQEFWSNSVSRRASRKGSLSLAQSPAHKFLGVSPSSPSIRCKDSLEFEVPW